MSEYASLQYCIEHSQQIAIQRRKKVYPILKDIHHISDWNDLITWKPNWNMCMMGLTKHEVEVLYRLKEKEICIRSRIEKGKEELLDILTHCEHHKGEGLRTYKILQNFGITNLRLLKSMPQLSDRIQDMYGIGPVRAKIILDAQKRNSKF